MSLVGDKYNVLISQGKLEHLNLSLIETKSASCGRLKSERHSRAHRLNQAFYKETVSIEGLAFWPDFGVVLAQAR
jgi:hypothetical protein